MAPPEREQAETSSCGRAALRRIVFIHLALKNNSRRANCRLLAEDMEVSAKTVQRDIDFMRDELRLPIDYLRKEFRFYYTEPVGTLLQFRGD